AGVRQARQHAAARHERGAAGEGHRRVLGLGSLADRGAQGRSGAVEVIRGGDVIAYLGFNVGLRSWVDQNGATIEKFLAAVSEADKWMRANPKQAAQVATRWIPGLKPEVAEAAMQFNIQHNDRRRSATNDPPL